MPKDYESPGRALTTAEEAKLERVFKAAADHPLWKTAALLSLLSMKCGAGPGEMLSLSLKDVGLDPPHISIPRRGAKRVSRERYLELNGTAAWALDRLIRRAIEECKCTLPDHFLIPRRNPITATIRRGQPKATELDCRSYWRSRRSKSVATIFAIMRLAAP
jgi:integrase